ncbi:hypothetical protein [Amycolatopsis sp. lyj-90]|uniref:hypothetical protein n=1 Tax=Amycolatopsis sp. lyj-90 TaxID=2789285 RepID=UPI00397DFBC4
MSGVRAVWTSAIFSALVATGLGVTINIATDRDGNSLAWILVGVFTVATVGATVCAHYLLNRGKARPVKFGHVNDGYEALVDFAVIGDRNKTTTIAGPVNNYPPVNGWFVLLVLGVCLMIMAATLVSGSVMTSSAGTNPESSGSALAPGGLVPAPREAASDALIATTVRVDSMTPYWASVFPADTGAYEKFRSHIERVGAPDLDNTLESAFRYGGYALGGVHLTVTLEGNSDRQVTVNSIRPVNIQRSDPALGIVVQGPSAGNGNPRPERLGYVLDADAPEPLTIDSSDTLRERYFDENEISLPGKTKQQFILFLLAEEKTATFDLEVGYEVGGQHFKTLVLDATRKEVLHLRASPDLCSNRRIKNPRNLSRPSLVAKKFTGVTFLPAEGEKVMSDVRALESESCA